VSFRLIATCPTTAARAGLLATAHGELPTPAFMPVGTLANVKTLTPADLETAGARCVLANAYHLALRPGAALVAQLGGLHRFMGWSGPILTDSGGFQVHSLARLSETSEGGVRFRSHLDDSPIELTPERVVEIQEHLGADLTMPLDVCLGPTASRDEAVAALERTRRWARRAQAATRKPGQILFGIVQGGLDAELRRQAARDLVELEFPGYAIGGLSVGEPVDLTGDLVGLTAAELPAERPRYLMGVGTPEQIVAYVALGIDMFDCVLPTRFGRTGMAFGGAGRVNLRRSEFAADGRPIDPECDCLTCQRFSRAYLHWALRELVSVGARLVSLHNVRSLTRCAEQARAAVLAGQFAEFLAGRSQPLPQPSGERPDGVVSRSTV
jgi:queuine tRNA-ribosyltransferase